MSTSRRNFLKLLPLAPLAAFTVKVDGQEAIGRELTVSKERRYVFHFPNLTRGQHEEMLRLKAQLQGMGYNDPLVIGGEGSKDLQIYEVTAHPHPATHAQHTEPHADCFECIVRAIEKAKKDKRI